MRAFYSAIVLQLTRHDAFLFRGIANLRLK